jgi:hypothetical protein
MTSLHRTKKPTGTVDNDAAIMARRQGRARPDTRTNTHFFVASCFVQACLPHLTGHTNLAITNDNFFHSVMFEHLEK